MRYTTAFEDPDFMEWFNGRPLEVQDVIREYPPDVEYKLDGPSPVWIYSYDVEKDGTVSLTVNVHSPFMPRSVFGIKPEDLQVMETAGAAV